MRTQTSRLSRRTFLGITTGAALGMKLAATAETSINTPGASFTFAVIADPHCAEEPKAGYAKCGGGVDKLLRCFEMMKNLPEKEQPDFALIAGDIHPAAIAPHLHKITLPVHVVAGNHEGSAESRGQLRAMFPEDFGAGETVRDYYSFSHKGVRFIGMCDAGAGGDHIGHFSSELIEPRGQCEWLEKELERQGERKVLFAHIPPLVDGEERNMYMGRNDARWFAELVEKTAPEMLFFGHLHKPTEEYRIGAARALNVRSCCWNFGDVPIGFLVVRVEPDGMSYREIFTGECGDRQ